MAVDESNPFYACYRELEARLRGMGDKAESAWDGYSSYRPHIPLELLLELLAYPVPPAEDKFAAITVAEFVSWIVKEGFLLPREQRCRLSSALVAYTKSLPAEATNRVFDDEHICDLIKRLPLLDQTRLVREMCESKGGWHMQSLASWLAEPPISFYFEGEEGKSVDELDQQFLALLQSMPILRESLESAAGPTAPAELRRFAPDALKRLDGAAPQTPRSPASPPS